MGCFFVRGVVPLWRSNDVCVMRLYAGFLNPRASTLSEPPGSGRGGAFRRDPGSLGRGKGPQALHFPRGPGAKGSRGPKGPPLWLPARGQMSGRLPPPRAAGLTL